MKYCGKNGYPMMCTVQRGRLPGGVPNKYMHKDKVIPHDHRAKVARFFEPITMVKECEEEGVEYTRVHVSFQSTGATNIQGVNYFNESMRFVKKSERGQKIGRGNG